MSNTLKHFTHSHILTKINFSDEFLCDGCNMLGSGVRYHCSGCKFDLHEGCATCPEKIDTYIHPGHKLTRVWEGLESVDGLLRLFYRCSSGRHCFFIHPLCSKFPSEVKHVIDNHHPLKFQSVPVIPGSRCAICRNIVSAYSWSYRCDPCGVNIHLECVTVPYGPVGQVHQEKRPVPPPASNPCGGSAWMAPPAYNNPPPNCNYGYAVPYRYPPPHACPQGATSSSGGKKRRMFEIACKIATTVILGATLGVTYA
ncbi:hypothetical protein MKW94_027748 [Papaver nudicaule]|uniref:DC1 domain-containing protein n=1 Tax=Papaver nudicaule TaxID=74823 RepID=A0AA41V5U6_PAPNU|nr:hypothetical protein [Papaver nudicaule]